MNTIETDMFCNDIVKKLPVFKNDPAILEIAKQKVQHLRNWLEEKGFDSILISRRENFAWLTVGGDNHVIHNTEFGVGHLLITRDEQFLLAYTMDGPRIMEEQISDQGYTLIVNDWSSGDPRLHASRLGGKKIASDSNFAGTVDCTGDIYLIHDPLFGLELDRLRWLGRTTALVFEHAVDLIRPGMSEWEIATILTTLFHSNQIELDVLLVGTDARARNFRHVIPTSRKLEKYILINPSARRWGLHANVSRAINFGPIDDEISKSYDIAAEVLTEMLKVVSPGESFSEVLNKMKTAYSSAGIQDGWKQHFPGGPTGYVLAECYCLTDLRLISKQAYDWFTTMPGIMIEELSILDENGLEIPSLGEKWPLKFFGNLNCEILLPDILKIT